MPVVTVAPAVVAVVAWPRATTEEAELRLAVEAAVAVITPEVQPPGEGLEAMEVHTAAVAVLDILG